MRWRPSTSSKVTGLIETGFSMFAGIACTMQSTQSELKQGTKTNAALQHNCKT